MPDLMTHLLIGLIATELFSIRKKSLVVLGALLPDLLSKFHLVFFYLGLQQPISFGSFHTPAVIFLVSILLAPLFLYNNLKTVLYINLGAATEFLSDLALRHFNSTGQMLLFPFTMKNFSLNLIWPDESIYVLLFSLVIYVLIKISKSQKIKSR